MEKKITNFRALMQERMKAMKEKQPVQPAILSEKKLSVNPRLKELMEKAKQARLEKKGTKTAPVSFREKMLARIEELKKKQQLKNKEVQP